MKSNTIIIRETIGSKFSEENTPSILILAGCNYSPEKIALYLDVDKKAFLGMVPERK
jgi:hypothetical protein